MFVKDTNPEFLREGNPMNNLTSRAILLTILGLVSRATLADSSHPVFYCQSRYEQWILKVKVVHVDNSGVVKISEEQNVLSYSSKDACVEEKNRLNGGR